VNRGLKRSFSLYRSLHLIKAYVWPKRYWLVWAGPLANHPFNFNFIFLSDGITAAAERAACFADLYRASRCYSAATDGHRVAKLAWGVPGLLSAQRCRLRSPANSSSANIAANPPKTRIPPTTAN
jgi:hypothetical protein